MGDGRERERERETEKVYETVRIMSYARIT